MVNPIVAYDDLWLKVAKKNTEIFDSVFPSKPSDNHKDLSSFDLFAAPKEKEIEKLADISGLIFIFGVLIEIGTVIFFPLELFAEESHMRHGTDTIFL